MMIALRIIVRLVLDVYIVLLEKQLVMKNMDKEWFPSVELGYVQEPLD